MNWARAALATGHVCASLCLGAPNTNTNTNTNSTAGRTLTQARELRVPACVRLAWGRRENREARSSRPNALADHCVGHHKQGLLSPQIDEPAKLGDPEFQSCPSGKQRQTGAGLYLVPLAPCGLSIWSANWAAARVPVSVCNFTLLFFIYPQFSSSGPTNWKRLIRDTKWRSRTDLCLHGPQTGDSAWGPRTVPGGRAELRRELAQWKLAKDCLFFLPSFLCYLLDNIGPSLNRAKDHHWIWLQSEVCESLGCS